MKGKLKKVLIALLMLALVGTDLVGEATMAYAGTASAIVINEAMDNAALALTPGEVKHMRVPIKAVGDAIQQATAIVSATDVPFTMSQAAVTTADQTVTSFVSNFGSTYVDFTITVKESAKIGTYPITIKISGKSPSDDSTYTQSVTINMQILKELAPAQITLSEANVKNPTIGGEAMVSFTLKNEGEMTARNTYYSIDFGTTNIC